jgi:hypothetical protein
VDINAMGGKAVCETVMPMVSRCRMKHL